MAGPTVHKTRDNGRETIDGLGKQLEGEKPEFKSLAEITRSTGTIAGQMIYGAGIGFIAGAIVGVFKGYNFCENSESLMNASEITKYAVVGAHSLFIGAVGTSIGALFGQMKGFYDLFNTKRTP